ncbi:hypothetical protein AVEN_38475-1 [Araneus ventricosus]|uniref:Uncharacterized protein n=1 Tax=Araneus ventricosus TaxID=182803 RepID=A0A4Y2H550_ARAVE|nr:hypothetical protein AVEN_38475-1 [Araneus ventricosus]
MGDKEKEALHSFKDVVHRFSENTKDPLYKTNVQSMLTAYEAQECKMRLKVHFLLSHIVKSRVKDFTRMSMISRGDAKEDGTHLKSRELRTKFKGRSSKVQISCITGSDGQIPDNRRTNVLDSFQESVRRCELYERMDESCESQPPFGLSPRIRGGGQEERRNEAADLERLMSLVNAECPQDVRGSLEGQYFVDAIRDEDTQYATRLMGSKDLKSFLVYSMTFEAAETVSRTS